MIIVPVQNYADYYLRMTLSNQVYIVRLTYNGREDSWYFSIATEQQPILDFIKVVSNFPLTRRYANPLLPAGDFFALDFLKLGDPGRNDLGSNIPFLYLEDNELRAYLDRINPDAPL